MKPLDKKRKEPMGICMVFVVVYLILYILTLSYENAISPGMNINYILEMNVKALVVMGVLMVIPYEKISYIWNRDFYRICTGIKSSNNHRNMIIEAVIVYGVLAFAANWINETFFRWRYGNTKLLCALLTMVIIFIMVNTFQMINNNILLFATNIALIFLNAAVVYIISDSFYRTAIITIGLFAGWNVCNYFSGRKYKIINLFASTVCGAICFDIAVDITGRYRALSAWLNPTSEKNLPYSQEHLMLSRHSLNLPNDMDRYYQFNHPFMAVYSYLGIMTFVLMILVFAVATAAVIRSRKVLSQKRFMVLICVYSIWVVLYVYTLLADLGFVPTASNVNLMAANLYIPLIGIVIRLFLIKRVSEKVIELCAYNETVEDEHEENEYIHMLDKQRDLRMADLLICRYLIAQEHRMNIMEANINALCSDDGMIVDIEDAEYEAVKDRLPRNISELMKEIRMLYYEEGEDKFKEGNDNGK